MGLKIKKTPARERENAGFCTIGCKCHVCDAERLHRRLCLLYARRETSKTSAGWRESSIDYGRRRPRMTAGACYPPDIIAGVREAKGAARAWCADNGGADDWDDAVTACRDGCAPDRYVPGARETTVAGARQHVRPADATLDGNPTTLPVVSDLHLELLAIAMGNVLAGHPRAASIGRKVERALLSVECSTPTRMRVIAGAMATMDLVGIRPRKLIAVVREMNLELAGEE